MKYASGEEESGTWTNGALTTDAAGEETGEDTGDSEGAAATE